MCAFICYRTGTFFNTFHFTVTNYQTYDSIYTFKLFKVCPQCQSNVFVAIVFIICMHCDSTISQTSPCFSRVCSTSLLKTVRKGEITSFHTVFSTILYSGELSVIFIKFKICCLQSFAVWKSLKFVIWEWVKNCFYQYILQSSGQCS